MGFDPTGAARDAAAVPLSPAVVAGLLESTGRIVAAELSALGDELAGWRPAPGEWCANEVVGHLAEADRRGFTGRIRRILAAPPDQPPVEEGWDQPSVAAARGDCAKPAVALVEELLAGRAEAAELIRSLSPADLGRTATHQAVGSVAVGELLSEWVFHDRNHLRQLLAIGQARTWPTMGNTRRFTDPSA
jgi:hypothetical protein